MYKQRKCKFCGTEYQPVTSRHKHCSWECRFKDIARKFEGVGGCWEWPLSCNKQTGYGQFNPTASTVRSTHRVSYELFNGPIPEGLHVCHECDNRPCFNPKHLFLGTRVDNMQDMCQKGRWTPRTLPTGEAHHNAKLTEVAVKMIRETDLSAPKLAKLLGVDKSTIKRVRRGATWRT